MEYASSARPEYQEYLAILSRTLVLVNRLESGLPESLSEAEESLATLSQAITTYNQAHVPDPFHGGHQLMRQSLVAEEIVFKRMVDAYRLEDTDIIAQSKRIYENAGSLREQALAEFKAALQNIMESL